jgi:putative aldouronate transport system substrate-binding protein
MLENTDLDPADALMSAFITDNSGKYHGTESANYFGMLLMNPNLSDEAYERVMNLIDYCCTEEGQLVTHIGFEGTDYKMDNGSPVMLTDKDPSSVYPSIRFFCTLATRSDDFSLIDPSIPQAYRDRHRGQYQEKLAVMDDTTMAKIDWKVRFHSSAAFNQVQYTYSDEYCQLILKEGDLRANWEAWVAEKMQLIQPVLDELNA